MNVLHFSERIYGLIKTSRVWELSRGERLSFFIGFGIVLMMMIFALFANFLVPYDPYEIGETEVYQPPGIRHLLGTDSLGRDVFSRALYGARISISVGFLSVLLATFIGSTIGVITGFFGGKLDKVITLPMDALYSFPSFITALLIAAVLGGGVLYTALAIAIALIPRFYRVVRSVAVSLREEEFVEAEVSIGASDIYITFRHIYPLCFSVVIVFMTISIATSILSVAGLGFLGLGVPPPIPEWGTDLASGRRGIMSGVWWVTMGPSIFIFITVLGFNMLGDGLNKMLGAALEEI